MSLLWTTYWEKLRSSTEPLSLSPNGEAPVKYVTNANDIPEKFDEERRPRRA